nr:MAG TPA: hypothetical protein [Bacteriophage sp.]
MLFYKIVLKKTIRILNRDIMNLYSTINNNILHS